MSNTYSCSVLSWFENYFAIELKNSKKQIRPGKHRNICVRIACSGLIISSLLQVVNRLAASCELTADLMQVVNYRLAASCELQA